MIDRIREARHIAALGPIRPLGGLLEIGLTDNDVGVGVLSRMGSPTQDTVVSGVRHKKLIRCAADVVWPTEARSTGCTAAVFLAVPAVRLPEDHIGRRIAGERNPARPSEYTAVTRIGDIEPSVHDTDPERPVHARWRTFAAAIGGDAVEIR